MKKLLLLSLPLFMVFSCALEKEPNIEEPNIEEPNIEEPNIEAPNIEEPFEAPSIEAIEEVKASEATNYPTTEGEAKEFLLESFAAISELMEVTPMGSRETKTTDLSFENDQIKIEGSLEQTVNENEELKNMTTAPADGSYNMMTVSVSGSPKYTLTDAVADYGNHTYTFNGVGSTIMEMDASLDMKVAGGEPVEMTLDFEVKMAMAANYSVKRDDGLGAKFSYSYAETVDETINLDNMNSDFENKLQSDLEEQFTDVSVDVTVYNDANEEILTFTVPMSEIMVGM